MHNRLERMIGIVLLLSLSGGAWAATFSDGFDTPRDYLTDGVAGTGWDGFLGQGPGETVDALNASMDRAGALFIQSTNSYWEGAFNPYGPFLYKVIDGDFIATVQVTDFAGAAGATVTHCDAFLMARVANLEDAGAGEDFVCIHYFPTWVGNMRRQMDNGTETEGPNTGDGFNCARWLQLERVGNVFSFRRSFDGVTWTAVGDPITRDDMNAMPVQVGLAHSMYSGNTGYVAFDNFSVTGPSVAPPNKAFNPVPSGNDVPRDADLSWSPNETATAHDVYFGTSLEDVAAATRSDPRGVLLSQGQPDTTFDPGLLEYGQTYYWRIDEVEADGVTINKGEVWSFTVEPISYPVTGVTATASGSNKPNTGPEKTVDGSGLNDSDEHSTVAEDGWVSARGDPQWIQYELPEACKLDKMLVWNSNQAMEALFGFGVKDVTIDCSLDGDAWTTLGTFEFTQATGSPDYTADITVDFAGAVAKYVKLNIASNWGGIFQQYGLSEVRFYSIPVLAREPKPAPGATNLHPQVTMSWRAGREAASHELYIDSDPNAVADGAVAPISVTQPQYDFAANLGETYSWKVVEVNQAEDPASWAGPVWSFSTATSIVVDDFESYTNNSPKRVFQTWIDGGGFSPDDFFPNGHPGNGTGSYAGYDPALGNIMETATVYGGLQSMPMYYDNSAAPKISETERTFDEPQDWSKHGIATLVLYFRGDAANANAPLYVKINGTKVLYNDGAPSTATPLWTQWNIPLASVAGLNLKSVKTLTIGVGDGVTGGTGTIFIDSILLYAEPPAIPVPADPGTTGLVALYQMEGNVQDSVGTNHGTTNGEPGYTDGPAGMGQALAFDGVNDYVELPLGSLISSLESATFSVWVDVQNVSGGAWSRVFDFGTGTEVNMWLTPYAPSNTRFAITTSGSGGEFRADAPRAKSTGWHHIAVVIDSETMSLALYEDGTLVDTGETELLPKDLGVTTNNWLGQSEYTGDAYLAGSLDDLRIYNRALSAGEVRYLAGGR